MNMDEIQLQLERLPGLHNIPSASVTISYKGKTTHLFAGYRDMNQKLPPDSDTMYAIGSCSKSFTAAAICVLCDQGRIGLDDPVKDYIPEFQMYDSYVSTHLTIRDMLCHRCGLPRHELAWYPRLETYTEADMIQMFRYLKPSQPFRYKMQYQNQMFALAGFLIERVSGLSWKDFVKKYLIEPMGIGEIAYDAPELAASPDRALGYRYDYKGNELKEVPYAALNTMQAAGSLSMTSAQLAAWATMLMHDGKYNGKQILSQQMCREMTSPQMLISDGVIKPLENFVDSQSYGLGLFLENYRGIPVLQHGGHIDGFIADMCFVPSMDFACTVLTNAENPVSGRAIRCCLLDMLAERQPEDWVAILADFLKETRVKGETQPVPPSDTQKPCPVSACEICGSYRNPGYGSMEVTCQGDVLLAKLGTLTLRGTHLRNEYFIFTEDHVLPGEKLEGKIELDAEGIVTSIDIALDSATKDKICFSRVSSSAD